MKSWLVEVVGIDCKDGRWVIGFVVFSVMVIDDSVIIWGVVLGGLSVMWWCVMFNKFEVCVI